jgi:hypothetical protein
LKRPQAAAPVDSAGGCRHCRWLSAASASSRFCLFACKDFSLQQQLASGAPCWFCVHLHFLLSQPRLVTLPPVIRTHPTHHATSTVPRAGASCASR